MPASMASAKSDPRKFRRDRRRRTHRRHQSCRPVSPLVPEYRPSCRRWRPTAPLTPRFTTKTAIRRHDGRRCAAMAAEHRGGCGERGDLGLIEQDMMALAQPVAGHRRRWTTVQLPIGQPVSRAISTSCCSQPRRTRRHSPRVNASVRIASTTSSNATFQCSDIEIPLHLRQGQHRHVSRDGEERPLTIRMGHADRKGRCRVGAIRPGIAMVLERLAQPAAELIVAGIGRDLGTAHSSASQVRPHCRRHHRRGSRHDRPGLRCRAWAMVPTGR